MQRITGSLHFVLIDDYVNAVYHHTICCKCKKTEALFILDCEWLRKIYLLCMDCTVEIGRALNAGVSDVTAVCYQGPNLNEEGLER